MSSMLKASKPKSETFCSVVLPGQENSTHMFEASADFHRWSISALPVGKGYDVPNTKLRLWVSIFIILLNQDVQMQIRISEWVWCLKKKKMSSILPYQKLV